MNFINILYECYREIKLDVSKNTYLFSLLVLVLYSIHFHFIRLDETRNKGIKIADSHQSSVFKLASLPTTSGNHYCQFPQSVVCKHIFLYT